MQLLIFSCIMYRMVIMIHASDTVAELLTPNIETEDLSTNTSSTDSISVFVGKHELLASCVIYSAEPGEYELFENGSIFVMGFNVTLNETLYVLQNDTVHLCHSFLSNFSTNEAEHKGSAHKTPYFWIFSLIGFGISMVSLLIHLIIFVIVPDLKNMPGCNLAALCASLFCSYLFLFVVGTGKIAPYQGFCSATAFMSHFFLLASFLWMSIMSYDVFVSLLRVTGRFRSSNTKFSVKRFGIYCLCSFGIALLFAVTSLLADSLDAVPEQFKPKYKVMCWFTNKTSLSIFFVGPAIALSCLNFIFFGLSAFILHYNKMHKDDEKSLYKGRYLMYFRLSVVMGITWIVGVLANVANVTWLWFIFVLLNTLQGFFIFVAFTCCKKVKKYFKEKYFGRRRSSEQSLTPTFISYCSYDNSPEKVMDKTAESSEENTKTTTLQQ